MVSVRDSTARFHQEYVSGLGAIFTGLSNCIGQLNLYASMTVIMINIAATCREERNSD